MQRAQDVSPNPEATVMEKRQITDALADAIAAAKERIESGDLEGGLAAFRRIADENADVPEVYNNLGAICAAMGRRDEAEQAFGRAAELTPDAANPWYNRGLMRFQSGNYLGALEDFERAGGLDPDDAEFLNNQGVVHFQLQDFETAGRCFARAVELRPDYVAARLNLVDVDLAQARVQSAYDRARELAAETDDPDVQAKWIECSVTVAIDAIDRAQADCEELQGRVAAPQVLLDQAGRLLRAKQILLEEDAVAATF